MEDKDLAGLKKWAGKHGFYLAFEAPGSAIVSPHQERQSAFEELCTESRHIQLSVKNQ